MGQWLELGRSTYPIILIILIGSGLLASVAIWRSSTRSRAPRAWVYAARSAVVLAWLAVSSVALTIVVFRLDFRTTSHTIQAELQPDPALPYIGFWKGYCEDDFGAAIQKAAGDAYFVRFCGPGGCTGKTRFARTSLVNDPRYRILDRDTIGIHMKSHGQPDLRELSPEDRERIQKRMRGDLMLYRRCN